MFQIMGKIFRLVLQDWSICGSIQWRFSFSYFFLFYLLFIIFTLSLFHDGISLKTWIWEFLQKGGLWDEWHEVQRFKKKKGPREPKWAIERMKISWNHNSICITTRKGIPDVGCYSSSWLLLWTSDFWPPMFFFLLPWNLKSTSSWSFILETFMVKACLQSCLYLISSKAYADFFFGEGTIRDVPWEGLLCQIKEFVPFPKKTLDDLSKLNKIKL